MNESELERRFITRSNAAFDKWLSEPMVRICMAQIPATDYSDTLKLLLRSAFDAGFRSGSGDLSFLETILMPKPENVR